MALILVLGGGCMPSGRRSQEEGPTGVRRVPIPGGGSRPLLIAHRCGAGLGPENTCAALVQSSFYRPDYYEVDIRHTADGVPICMHDETVNRTTNLTGRVDQLTLEELASADAGTWVSSTYTQEPIPTFNKMLDCVNPSSLVIELKEAGITVEECSAISDLLAKRDDWSSLVVSFEPSAIEAFRQADPERRTGYLTTKVDQYALSGQHEIVGLQFKACNPEVVTRIHDAGKAVWVWTVNSGFQRFMEMGIDAIVTDYPDRLRETLPPS